MFEGYYFSFTDFFFLRFLNWKYRLFFLKLAFITMLASPGLFCLNKLSTLPTLKLPRSLTMWFQQDSHLKASWCKDILKKFKGLTHRMREGYFCVWDFSGSDLPWTEEHISKVIFSSVSACRKIYGDPGISIMAQFTWHLLADEK